MPWVKVATYHDQNAMMSDFTYIGVVSQMELGMQEPLFEQHAVRGKMSSFHSKLMSLEFHCCSTCLECLPELTMGSAGSTECRRCFQDKHIPKLYSTPNNMNPGVVPPQLQVTNLFI